MKEQMKRIALTYPNRYDSVEMNEICEARIGAMADSLISRGFDVTRIPRDDLPQQLDDYDLVVAAGGDGTQLDAAIRIRRPDTWLCGVRLFPERSIGYLCRMDYGVRWRTSPPTHLRSSSRPLTTMSMTTYAITTNT